MAAFNSQVLGQSGNRREPAFIDETAHIASDHFYLPEHYNGCLDSLLLTHGTIKDRVEKLAMDIVADYQGETIHLLCVLKGGATFYADLSAAIGRLHDYSRKTHIPYTFDFIRVKSYEGMSSTGKVAITGCDIATLEGKHVLFVEDLIDTGLTMSTTIKYLREQVRPASVRVASLLEKRTPQSCGFKADYVGFSIPDAFVVGYGMDYNEVFRDLNHLAVISQEGIRRYAVTNTEQKAD